MACASRSDPLKERNEILPMHQSLSLVSFCSLTFDGLLGVAAIFCGDNDARLLDQTRFGC